MKGAKWLLILPAVAIVLGVGIWIGHKGVGDNTGPRNPSNDAVRQDSVAKVAEPAQPTQKHHTSARPIVGVLEGYLRSKGSPMKGCASAFVSCADTFGVDPRLVVAISGAESGFGKHVCAPHNAWNWFHCYATRTCAADPCANSPFPTWTSGGRTIAKFLKRSYLNKGYVTLDLIATKYCTQGCDHWLPNVTRFYTTDLGGNASDLTWPVRHIKPSV